MTGAGLLSVALLSRCSRAGQVPGLPARSARAGPAGSPAPSSYRTAFEPCRRTLPVLVAARLVPMRRRRIVPLRDALAVASMPRDVSGRRDCSPCAARRARLRRTIVVAMRRLVVLYWGAAVRPVFRFAIAFRRIGSSSAAAPRRIRRLRAAGAGQSAGLRRHVRGGTPPFRSSAAASWSCARSWAAPRFRAHAPAAVSRFEVRGWTRLLPSSCPWLGCAASPRARCAWTVRCCCRLPKPRVGSGSHAADSSVVSLRFAPTLERSISSCGQRFVEEAAIRRPSPVGADRGRGASHSDRHVRCAPSGCAACGSPALFPGPPMRTWRRRPAVTDGCPAAARARLSKDRCFPAI